MEIIDKIASKLPSVIKPVQKQTFRQKLIWTGLILVVFYVLGSVTAWGVDTSAVAQFEFLEIVLGSKFGSLITLGIGPIVTASIILQLLVGSKILNWDTNSPEGRAKFQGTQKILAVIFCFLEAAAYVMAGAVPPIGGSMFFAAMLIIQLSVGGIIIIFMDEVVSKWGIGSGVSLFIAAGVAKTIVLGTFAPPSGTTSGIFFNFIQLFGVGNPMQAFFTVLPLVATLFVFIIVVYSQAMKVEIPLAFSLPFGKFAARRWPLRFIYASNIPVILVAAVIANVQVFAKVLSARGIPYFGMYDSAGNVIGGMAYYMSAPMSAEIILMTIFGGLLSLVFAYGAMKGIRKHALRFALLGGIVGVILGYLVSHYIPGIPIANTSDYIRSLTYMTVMLIGSVIFSIFWVNTAGMDAKTVSGQFESSFIMIPGFRRDPRIMEGVLNKYIPALTVLGGAFVGFLAGFADLTGALGSGTGILLTVMIVYQFYEQIVRQHSDDIPPRIRKFLGI